MAASRVDWSAQTRSTSDRFLFRRRLRRIVRQFRQLPEGELPSPELLRNLRAVWENTGDDHALYDAPFLSTVVDWATSEDRAILETGTGVSTILLGLLAERNELQVVAVERDHRAHVAMRRQLDSLQIRSIDLRYGDLSNPITQEELPDSIGLVVIDTSPDDRCDVLTHLVERLAGDSVILVDNADLSTERDRVQHWLYDLPTELISDHESHLVLGYARNRIVRMLPKAS